MNKVTVKNAGISFQVFIRDSADESVVAEIFKHHEYRAAEEIIKNATFPIIDVGAHAGFFSLYVRSLNPTVQIIAVEPEPNNVAQLQKHFKENSIRNVDIIEAAIAGNTGTRPFYQSLDSHNHSLLTPTDSAITVPTLILSGLFKKCIIKRSSLLKLDIEGAEYEVFLNTKPELFKNIGAIILEYHTVPGEDYKMLELLLRENGYSVRHFPSKFDKTMGIFFAQRKLK
jgi:FkbM family methyltransferase